MKRHATKIVLFLLLGAIINVAVAVLLAAFVTVSPVWIKKDVSIEYWMRNAGDTKAHDARTRYAEHVLGSGIGYRYTVLSAGYSSADYSSLSRSWTVEGYHHVVRAGLPLLCMEADRPETFGANDHWNGIPVAHGSIDLGVVQLRERPLPVRPIWAGFAINTIFYAAILWLLLAFPFPLRRRRRIKRGLCPACAYPIGASAVCSECGATVKPTMASDS